MKVVFDWDGVFNNQTEFICDHLGIPYPNRYHSHEATNLTRVQADMLQLTYSDMELYKQMPLVEGFYEALFLPCGPYVYSCNMSLEMLDYKKRTVHAAHHWFPKDHLILLDGVDKPPIQDADVVVEDSPKYLAAYGADVYKILIDHSYNRDAMGKFVRVPSLTEALRIINEMDGRAGRGWKQIWSL